MERTSVSLLSGLILVAALQLRSPILTPTASPTSAQSSTSSTSGSGVAGDDDMLRGANNGLPRNEEGPWAALCRYLISTEEIGQQEPGVVRRKVIQESEISQEVDGKGNTHRSTVKYQVRQAAPLEDFASCRDRDPLHHKYRVMIASVPDPIASPLALEYDRVLEALERGASDAGYSFARYWVPWNEIYRLPQTDVEKAEKTDEKRHLREEQPGMLLFHRTSNEGGSEILLIFIVGETPSAGINKIAFSRAVVYASLFLESAPNAQQSCTLEKIGAEDLLVFGPSFSGSLESLKLVLASPNVRKKLPSCTHINTGSATNRGKLDEFSAWLDTTKDQQHRILFTRTTYNDDERNEVITKFFKDRYGYDQERIALLGEGGSGYFSKIPKGEDASSRTSSGPIVLNFPRGIAPVREAYQAAQESAPKTSQEVPRALNTLPLTLRAVEGAEQDLPAKLSRAQTAVSQDAVLRQISHTLRQRRAKAAVIFATDNLDTVFLLRYLRMSNPDVLLALPSADLLYVRPGDEVDLAGTVSFTHLPLFAADKLFVKFPSTFSQSAYLCVRSLLLGKTPYGSHAPDLWAAVTGEDTFWPVAKLKSGAAGNTPWLRLSADEELRTFVPHRPTKLWGILIAVLSLAALVHCAACGVGMWANVPQPVSVSNGRLARVIHKLKAAIARFHDRWWLEYYVTDPIPLDSESTDDKETRHENRRRRPERAFYLFCGTLIVGLAQWLILLPTWRLYLNVSATTVTDRFFDLLVLSSAVFAVTVTTALALWLRQSNGRRTARRKTFRDQPSDTDSKPENSRYVLALIALALFSLSAFFWGRLCLDGDSGVAFSFRSTAPLSGVSPVVPFLMFLIALYLWTWTNLRRIVYFETRRPDLPKLPDGNNSGADFHALSNSLKKVLGRDVSPFAITIVVCSFVLSIIAWAAGLFPRSVDGATLDITLVPLLALLTTLLCLVWTRFILSWLSLRKLLRALERTPLRYAFSRLPEKFSWSPVWKIGGGRRSFVLQTRSLEYVHCVARTQSHTVAPAVTRYRGALAMAAAPAYAPGDRIVKSLKVVLEREQAGLRLIPASIKHLRQDFCALAEEWAEDLAGWFSKGGADACGEDLKRREDVPCPDSLRHDQIKHLKAEFVALRYVAHVRYVSLQMRNQLVFVSFGFVFALLALKVYPFQQQQTISWLIIAVFAVLSAGVVMVFADMDRDDILSRISGTSAGKLDSQFWIRISAFGIVPLMTVLASQFPAISSLLFSWIRPGLEMLK
jgi:hypothetical protein